MSGFSTRLFPEGNISKVYVHELFEALRRSEVYDVDFGLSEDEGLYTKINRDATLEFLIRYRSQLVAGREDEWSIQAAANTKEDRIAAKVIRALMGKIKRFSSARYNLAQAFLKGNTWAHLNFGREMVTVPGMRRMPWTIVKSMQDIDKRRFDRTRNDKTRNWDWQLAIGLDEGGPTWETVKRGDFVQHVYHDLESSLGHGSGLSAAIYFILWFKAEAIRNGMQFINRWSQGLIVYSISALASAAKGNTSEVRAGNALAMLDSIRAGQNIVVDEVDDVKVHDAPKGGWATVLEAIEYMDRQASRLILASVLPTGGGNDAVGSLARAQVEDTALGRLISFDRELLAETITDRVVRPLWNKNKPLLSLLGMANANMPKFIIRTDPKAEPKDRMAVIKEAFEIAPDLRKMVSVDAFAKIADLPLVDEDDDQMTLDELMPKEELEPVGTEGGEIQ